MFTRVSYDILGFKIEIKNFYFYFQCQALLPISFRLGQRQRQGPHHLLCSHGQPYRQPIPYIRPGRAVHHPLLAGPLNSHTQTPATRIFRIRRAATRCRKLPQAPVRTHRWARDLLRPRPGAHWCSANSRQVPGEEGRPERAVWEGTTRCLLPGQILGRPQYKHLWWSWVLLWSYHHVSYYY